MRRVTGANLRETITMKMPQWEHAIVIGGGIAGLLAARVLSESFRRVSVLERDPLTDDSEPRKGVPQGHQIHAILTPSYEVIQELFPGLADEMAAEGATLYESGIGIAMMLNGCWAKPVACGLTYIACTRPFYEAKIRNRVRTLRNVTLYAQQRVDSLIAGGNGEVAGVLVENLITGVRERIDGDLVVDASGRATKTPRWLEALGFESPPVEEVEIGLRYVGAIYEAPPNFRA